MGRRALPATGARHPAAAAAAASASASASSSLARPTAGITDRQEHTARIIGAREEARSEVHAALIPGEACERRLAARGLHAHLTRRILKRETTPTQIARGPTLGPRSPIRRGIGSGRSVAARARSSKEKQG